MTHAELDKLVQPFLEALGEHCDSVQLLATWCDVAGTHRYFIGAGNWYARKGLAMEFLEQDQAQTNAAQLSQAIREEQDGDE